MGVWGGRLGCALALCEGLRAVCACLHFSLRAFGVLKCGTHLGWPSANTCVSLSSLGVSVHVCAQTVCVSVCGCFFQ